MKGDIPEVALRLLQALPVRTHERKDPVPVQRLYTQAYEKRKRVVTGKGRGGNNAKTIRIDVVTYKTIAEARRVLKIGNYSMQLMLANGRAEVVT